MKKIKKEEEQNPSKSIKSNTNNNQNPKNVDQNWLKYKLDDTIGFLEGLMWKLRQRERKERGKEKKINYSPTIVLSSTHPNQWEENSTTFQTSPWKAEFDRREVHSPLKKYGCFPLVGECMSQANNFLFLNYIYVF